MVNNGQPTSSSTFPAIFLFFLSSLIAATGGTLYPFGTEFGDEKIDFAEWKLGSQEINLTDTMPLFGQGKLSSVWVNTIGALSFREMTTAPKIDSVINNILFSPFYAQSQDGAIYYRQTTTEKDLFDIIEDDFETTFILPPNEGNVENLYDFRPTYALVVTWTDVASERNPDQKNSFQAVLASDGKYSFAIYNYEDIQWSADSSGSHAAAGLFVSPNTESSCFYELTYSQTSQITQLPRTVANSGETGRYVLIISEPFECVSKFESPCEKELPASEWGQAKPYFGISDSWDTYVIHSCNAGFEMKPGVNKERIDCVYEADYYDSTWETDPSRCFDLNATRKIEIKVEVEKVGNDSVGPIGNLTEKEKEGLKNVIENSIKFMVNLTDVIITVTNITTRNIGENETVLVEVEILIPPHIHKRITVENITKIITEKIIHYENWSETETGIKFKPVVNATDATDECLQGCMCRFKKGPKNCPKGKNPLLKPDACCGGCNGKPYSTTIKACCNNSQVYDPLKSRCCDGRIRKGATGACP